MTPRCPLPRVLSAALVAVALFAGAATALAIDEVPQFAVARIGLELAPTQLSFAHAVSEDGDAVGEVWLDSSRQAFVYTFEHGPMYLPLYPGLPNARAFDVSDRDINGEIIICGSADGSFLLPDPAVGVFWRYSTVIGQVLETGSIGVLPGFERGVAVAVNNDGRIIGHSIVPGTQSVVYDVATDTLTSIDFPAPVADLNNLGQVTGGRYRGDLGGNAVDLGIPPTASGMTNNAINDVGWTVGTANMPFTDGAGHFVTGNARFADDWLLLYAFSHFDGGNDLNIHGDIVGSLGAMAQINAVLYIDALDQLFFINDLIDPSQPMFVETANAINDAGQIAVGNQAALLTPLGVMIIPGDVNGDADVTFADLCAWRSAPIDLDGDGDADGADEQWLIDRLATLGLVAGDCNANDVPDPCDISDGTSTDCNENGVPDDCEPDCDGDGVPDDCESDCNGNGVPDDCDIATGASEDCNTNGIPDECDGATTVTHANPFDPPVLLLADETFTDDFLVTDAGAVADVDVTLDIDYRIGNLVVRLTHAGTTITLVDQPGVPQVAQGNGQLGYRITLDDEGSGPNIETVGNFGSPFEPVVSPPSYQPHQPLSAFDGLPVDGLWTIEVTTIGFSPVSGFIEWGLVITDEAIPVGECACIGDTDGDGRVDTDDVVNVILDWGTGGAANNGDVDASGLVDVDDVVRVVMEWGPCP